MTERDLPLVIQGGMGVAVSSWPLAAAVARTGNLGVVSGTALDTVLVRRLQDGDPDGHARRAMAAFPVPELAEGMLRRYLRVGGRGGTPYRPGPRLGLRQSAATQQLLVLGAFVEVWLAREGHGGLVGINLLEKVQMAIPATALGAMLAGVDYVLVGAGLPRQLPGLLDGLAGGQPVSYQVDVAGAGDAEHAVTLDPGALLGGRLPLTRPRFLAIVSANVLAGYLARDERTRPDGFVIEGPRAGGHNAPPRGPRRLDADGQPVFGPRDEADPLGIAALGLPFWMAGGFGTPEALAMARAQGAAGVQVGTAFALSHESGLVEELRAQLLDQLLEGSIAVRTDPLASPTGFPFKVAQLPGTLADPGLREARPRLCDLGYLRTAYVAENGALGYRCPAEPVHTYLRKGGRVEDTEGRVCLCNALTATVGLAQRRADGWLEPALVTLGADLAGVTQLQALHPQGWSAGQVVSWLTGAATV